MSIINNLRKIMTGSVLSQVIVISSLPFITQLYNPEELGFYAMLLSLVSIIGMVSSLRLERSLFSLYGSEEFSHRFSGAISVSILSTLLLTFILYVLIKQNILDIDKTLIPFISVWGWGVSIIQILTVFNSSYGNFGLIAKSSVVRSAVLVFFQVLLYFSLEPNIALIVSAITSVFISVLILGNNSNVKFEFINPLKYIKSKFFDCINGFFQSSFSAINNNISIIIISQLWGVKSAGLFMLSEKLIRVPINLISNNLRPVLANQFQTENNKNIKFIFKVSSILFLLSMFFVVILMCSIDLMVSSFLGDEWLESSSIIKILSFWVVFNFSSLPFQSFNIHFTEMKYTTFIEGVNLIIKVLGLSTCYYMGGELYSACIIIVFSSLVSLLLNVYVVILKLKVIS